jgi:hypothetical protein
MSIIRQIWNGMFWRFSIITPAVTATQSSHHILFWLTLLSRFLQLFLADCCRYFPLSDPPTLFNLKTLCFEAQSCAFLTTRST